MTLLKQKTLHAAMLCATLVLFLLLSGCTVKLMSSYDEKTDNAVTALQQNVEMFFVTVESQAGLSECAYSNHISFYQQSKVAVSSIAVRAKAIPDNDITVEQVELLKSSITMLEQLHRLGCFTPAQVENLRNSFNSSITAILKLELAKRRGS